MEVRDAVEADAETLAGLAEVPRDVLMNVIHDRTVKVAETDGTVAAFVSYDARPGTVYVTQLAGDPPLVERLLGEPIRFAERESMAVELLIASTNEALAGAATSVGFEHAGAGPGFDGVRTDRFRYEPDGDAGGTTADW